MIWCLGDNAAVVEDAQLDPVRSSDEGKRLFAAGADVPGQFKNCLVPGNKKLNVTEFAARQQGETL